MNIGPDDYDFTFLKWLEEDPLMNQAAPSLPFEHARSLRRPYRDLHHMRYVRKEMRWGEIRDLSDHSAPSPFPPRFFLDFQTHGARLNVHAVCKTAPAARLAPTL